MLSYALDMRQPMRRTPLTRSTCPERTGVAAAVTVGLAMMLSLACEQRFSSTPGRSPADPAAASDAGANPADFDVLWARNPFDAGHATAVVEHAMTVTLCSMSPDPCPTPPSDAPGEARYRVVYGSSRPEVRSRGQAMADVFKEMRDRTAAGERLVVEPRAPGEAGAPTRPPGAGESTTTAATAGNGDPLSRCAFHVLDLVDGTGGITLDVARNFGSRGCLVQQGWSATAMCLVQGPDAPARPGH